MGGNSLVKDEKRKSSRHQYMIVKETAHHIADMIEAGWDMAIGHGNGPQLGFALRRSEVAFRADGVPAVPMDICIALNQAEVGYALQQNLQNELFKRGIKNRWQPSSRRCWWMRMTTPTACRRQNPSAVL